MTPKQAQQQLGDLRVVKSRVNLDLSERPVRWEVADADLRALVDALDAPPIPPGTAVSSLWGMPVHVDENAATWQIVSYDFPTDRLRRRVAWHVLEHGSGASVEFLDEPMPKPPGPPWKHSPAGLMAKLIAGAQGETDAGPPADLSQIEADLQALPNTPVPEKPKPHLAPAKSFEISMNEIAKGFAVPPHLLGMPLTHAEAVEREVIAQALRDLADAVLTNGLKTNAIESLKATKDHVYRLTLTVTKETHPWTL